MADDKNYWTPLSCETHDLYHTGETLNQSNKQKCLFSLLNIHCVHRKSYNQIITLKLHHGIND